MCYIVGLEAAPKFILCLIQASFSLSQLYSDRLALENSKFEHKLR